MKRVALSAALSLFVLAGGRAHAEEPPGTPSGISVVVGLESFSDGTVTMPDGGNLHDRGGHFEAAMLANFHELAVGGVAAAMPGIFGDGRSLYGARVGFVPMLGTTRLQVIGEYGLHRYSDVAGTLFSSSTPNQVDTSYLGFQIGFARRFSQRAPFECGLALFVRQDQNKATVLHHEGSLNIFGGVEPDPPPTPLVVGGSMIGLSLTVGVRVEPWR